MTPDELFAFHANAYNIVCMAAIAERLRADPVWEGNTGKFRRCARHFFISEFLPFVSKLS
jgi:hypothetical protein